MTGRASSPCTNTMTAIQPVRPQRLKQHWITRGASLGSNPDEFAAGFVTANKYPHSKSNQRRHYEDLAAQASAAPTNGCDMASYYRKLAETAEGGGYIRLVPYEGLDAYQRFAGDIAYLYDIRCVNGKIRVTGYTTSERDDVWTVEKFIEG